MKVDDHIRNFGMSGLLMSDELRSIEERFDIKLGHTTPKAEKDGENYFPQFELAVRKEAARMAQHYEVFYCLEQAVRKAITEVLEEVAGKDWWNTNVAQNIRDEVALLQKREDEAVVTRRSDRAIDYTTFGQLSVIITNNWSHFEPVFKNQRGVQRVLTSLNLLRGPIAHCCPMSEDETDRLRLTVKDWFRLMG